MVNLNLMSIFKSPMDKALDHAKNLNEVRGLSLMRAADSASSSHKVDFIILFNKLVDWADENAKIEHDEFEKMLHEKYPTQHKFKDYLPMDRSPFNFK